MHIIELLKDPRTEIDFCEPLSELVYCEGIGQRIPQPFTDYDRIQKSIFVSHLTNNDPKPCLARLSFCTFSFVNAHN